VLRLAFFSSFAIFNLMVKYSEQKLDAVFGSLADPTRRAILRRVAEQSQPLTVSAIAAPYRMSLPAVSKHLKVLEEAALIRREKRGRQHVFSLRPEMLQTAAEHVAYYRQYWERQFDSLEAYLDAASQGRGRG